MSEAAPDPAVGDPVHDGLCRLLCEQLGADAASVRESASDGGWRRLAGWPAGRDEPPRSRPTNLASPPNLVEGTALVRGERPLWLRPLPRADGAWLVVAAPAERPPDAREDDLLERVAALLASGLEGGPQAWLERERGDALARRARQLEVVGALAGGVAHDLNNYLSAVAGFADLAAGELPETGVARDHVRKLTEATAMASRVARCLHAFARTTRSRRETVALRDLVATTVRLFRWLLPEDVETVVDLPEDDPLELRADATQVQQALLNLVLYAREALLAEGGNLRIEGRRVRDPETGAEDVRLAVVDSGPSLSNAERAWLRAAASGPSADAPPERFQVGLAFGLLVEIARRHGGDLQVASPSGGGTRYTLLLPLQPAEHELPQAQPPRRGAPAGPPPSGARVLLVDPDSLFRALAATALRAAGYAVEQAASPDEALARFRADEAGFDLAVLSASLPAPGALGLGRELRRTGGELPLVLVAGRGDLPEVSDAHIVTLHKPFQVPDLVAAIRALDDERAARPRS